MFSVPDFLDRAKRGAGVDTDYALAKRLGHKNQANVSGWRNEKVAPDGRAILALCALSGDDPEHVAACVQAMRAANDDEAALWNRVAARLKNGLPSVAILSITAMVLLASYGVDAEAAPYPALSDATSLCVMSNAVLWFLRVLWRAGSLSRRTARRCAAV